MPRDDRPPYFPFYPVDFASDDKVEAMTTEAVGAYVLLLCKAWEQQPAGTVPNDDVILARWARVDAARWTELKPLVVAAFTLGRDGRLHQKRLKREHDKLRERLRSKADAGRKGGLASWQSRSSASSTASNVLEAEPNHSKPKSESEKKEIPAANREGEKRAGEPPGGGLAAADLGSELKKLGISSAKVKALLPDLSARGVFPIHVHLLAEELRGKKNIDDVAAVAVSRLENGFQPRQYLSIPEVAMLAKARPLISICGTPVNGAPLKVNNGSHRPGVFWDGPNGEKFEARPDDLRADAIVLARTGDDGGEILHDGRVRGVGA